MSKSYDEVLKNITEANQAVAELFLEVCDKCQEIANEHEVSPSIVALMLARTIEMSAETTRYVELECGIK